MIAQRIHNISRHLLIMLSVLVSAVSAGAFTVVIDAGHGGKDSGCVGTSVKEKDINLAVAQRVAKILSGKKDVKVVMTRSTDVFLPLQQRCDIANAAKGDIFVSIHTNSLPETAAGRDKRQGASVYTMGLSRAATNLEVAKRENSVIQLEDDYSTTYNGFDPNSTESYIIFELAQNSHIDRSLNLAGLICSEMSSKAGRVNLGVKQEPFWVLVRTSMPSVLVELDFICNPEVEEFLGSEAGRDQLAEAIAQGILNYKNNVGFTNQKPEAPAKQDTKPSKNLKRIKPSKPQPEVKPAVKETPATPGATTFRVQFLTSAKVLPVSDSRISFPGEVINHYTENGIVKYTLGDYGNLKDAQKALSTVKERYPDAFIITWRDGQRVKK